MEPERWQQIKQLYESALRRGESERAAHLEGACAGDRERLERFQREAHLLASLNHPNIATIHGLEESGGICCLVLELVPGETLAARLAIGPLGVEGALGICAQVAEALEAAHEKGIIH